MSGRKGFRSVAISLALASVATVTGSHADPLPVEQPGLPPDAAGAVASSNVEFLANFPQISAIGARIKGDYLYSTGVDGLSIYNIALTGLPILQGRLPLPHWQNEDVDTNGKLLLVAADHLAGSYVGSQLGTVAPPLEDEFDILYVIDVSVPQAPLLVARLPVPMAHTVTCILDCTFAWLAGGSGIAVVDLRVRTNPRYVGTIGYTGAGLTHDVQVDGNGIAWVSGSNGLWAMRPDPQAPTRPTPLAGSSAFDNDFIIHNSLRPDAKSWRPATSWSAPVSRGERIYVTEEDYLPRDPMGGGGGNGECKEDGSFQIGAYRQVGSEKRVAVYSTWNLGKGVAGELTGARKGDVAAFCSSHYFDVKRDIAAVGWYEQGVRFLSVSNVSRIRQVGYWRPLNSVAWGTVFVGDYVYVLDFGRGLDVLRFKGTSGGPTVKSGLAPVRSEPSADWGWACRLPVTV